MYQTHKLSCPMHTSLESKLVLKNWNLTPLVVSSKSPCSTDTTLCKSNFTILFLSIWWIHSKAISFSFWIRACFCDELVEECHRVGKTLMCKENTVGLDASYWISRPQNEDMYVKFIFIRILFLTFWSARARAKNWIWEKEKHSQESNIFSVDGAVRQTWYILSKNDNLQKFSFFFFLKFMMVTFLRFWSLKRSSYTFQYPGAQPQNLKNPCFSDLQVWISFKTSFSSFGLNKMTHEQISTYIHGAHFGAPAVIQPKIDSKFE